MAAIELSATTGGLTTNNIPVSLSNPVVLINVFNHLDAAVRGISEPSSKTDLLSAALACRAFCDPALDIVWKSLHTFVPLLKLLPPIGLTNNFYVFRRPFEASDWKRFDRYSRKVKVFTLNKATELAERTVALSTYMRLAQSRPQPLPNLVRLYIEVPCALLEQWPLFASSNLTHLEMAGIQIDHAHIIDPFMSILACLSRASMESLVLCGRFSWSNALGSFVQFRCLHSLIVSDPISAETLRGFGSLLGLRRLHVILEDTTVSDVPSDFGFSMLETLKIKGTPSVLQCVLDNMCWDKR